MSRFKSLNTIERFMSSLREGKDIGIDEEQPADATNPPQDASSEDNNPENQANPEKGLFISDNQKADIAKLLLDALMLPPPEAGSIPQNILNVTTNNADEVINYIKSLTSIDNQLDLNNENDPNSMNGALKDI